MDIGIASLMATQLPLETRPSKGIQRASSNRFHYSIAMVAGWSNRFKSMIIKLYQFICKCICIYMHVIACIITYSNVCIYIYINVFGSIAPFYQLTRPPPTPMIPRVKSRLPQQPKGARKGNTTILPLQTAADLTGSTVITASCSPGVGKMLGIIAAWSQFDN